MRVSDTNKNRGTHGDSSFKLGGMPSSSENPPALAVGSVKYVPVTRVWELETWGVELGGMISALSITIDALNDCPDSNSVELDAANGILCSLLKLKKEFDVLYSDISNSAVKADKIPTE